MTAPLVLTVMSDCVCITSAVTENQLQEKRKRIKMSRGEARLTHSRCCSSPSTKVLHGLPSCFSFGWVKYKAMRVIGHNRASWQSGRFIIRGQQLKPSKDNSFLLPNQKDPKEAMNVHLK